MVSLFIDSEWVYKTTQCKTEEEMIVKLQLQILGALKVIGHNAPFQTLHSDTISWTKSTVPSSKSSSVACI